MHIQSEEEGKTMAFRSRKLVGWNWGNTIQFNWIESMSRWIQAQTHDFMFIHLVLFVQTIPKVPYKIPICRHQTKESNKRQSLLLSTQWANTQKLELFKYLNNWKTRYNLNWTIYTSYHWIIVTFRHFKCQTN